MSIQTRFDIAFLGHYTKDTIVLANEEKFVDGGAAIYGANVAGRMGLRTAIITRMARQDLQVLEELRGLGVKTLVHEASESTRLRLVYPSSNLDERVIYIDGFAEPFSIQELGEIKASTFHVGATLRGEVPTRIVKSLRRRANRVSLDVQGFIRINANGRLVQDSWSEREEVLKCVNVVKADLVEASIITGTRDKHKAAEALAALGPDEVVLTHNTGVLVQADGRFYEAPFRPRQLKGRSGRGDTCIAAYLGKRLTSSPLEATVWAAALTSLKLESEGPFRRDVREVRELIERRYVV